MRGRKGSAHLAYLQLRTAWRRRDVSEAALRHADSRRGAL